MSNPLALSRAVLAEQEAWIVGGAVRDRALHRRHDDLDLVVAGDPRAAARAIGRAGGAAAFELSDEFGAWRVAERSGAWRIDVSRLRGATLADDLSLRDFTVNAIAEPLAGGELIDPLGGLRDLRARSLRAASPHAFADDPLRVLRLVRLAVALDFAPDPATARDARAHVDMLTRVAPERVFVELRGVLAAPAAVRGVGLMDELAITPVVLPELDALRGVGQNRFHHLDVHDHSVMALGAAVALARDPAAVLGSEHAGEVAAFLAQPLADELTRAGALAFAALLHDVAKPRTREQLPDGRVTFSGHDVAGAHMVRAILTRLRVSERLRAHVAALTLHHLRLGFLVHDRPLTRRALYGYLRTCAPVAVDVTLLSVADRLATRGDRAAESIDAHLRLVREVLPPALQWHANGPPAPLLRGDQLARAVSLQPGPRLGRLLEELRAAQYAGEVATPEQAVAFARARLAAERG